MPEVRDEKKKLTGRWTLWGPSREESYIPGSKMELAIFMLTGEPWEGESEAGPKGTLILKTKTKWILAKREERG